MSKAAKVLNESYDLGDDILIGHVTGVTSLSHFVKAEAWNTTSLCGKLMHADSLMEEIYSEKRICGECVAIHERTEGT